MSNYLIHLTEEEFKKQTLYFKDNLAIEFNNDSFKKGPTFSLTMREQAINYCHKMTAQQLKSFLVESKEYFTVWIQEQIRNTSKIQENHDLSADNSKTVMTDWEQKDKEIDTEISQKQTINNDSKTNQVATKKVIRKYRGQTYEIEIPDYSAISQKSQLQQKVRKKYRGQYID